MKIKRMEYITFTREELYKLVWSESLLALSKRYHISDVGLRKICIRMNIPIPQIGYWQKIQQGKPVEMRKLPAEKTVVSPVHLYLRNDDDMDFRAYAFVKKSLIKEISSDPRLPLTVPKKVTRFDKLVVEAGKNLKKVKIDGHIWDGLVHSEWGYLNIKVSPANIKRALRFMNAIIKLLKARGHNVSVSGSYTFALIGDEKIEVSLKEKMKMIEPDKRRGWEKYVPSGVLSFRIEGKHFKEWQDDKEPIENKLAVILAKLETEARRIKAERLYHNEQHREWEEKVRLEKERTDRIEKEKSDFKKLIDQARRLQLSAFLREYIDVVEKNARDNGTMNDELQNWLSWARGKADWYDPLVNKEDEILGMFNE
jgi:hypothetical protein